MGRFLMSDKNNYDFGCYPTQLSGSLSEINGRNGPPAATGFYSQTWKKKKTSTSCYELVVATPLWTLGCSSYSILKSLWEESAWWYLGIWAGNTELWLLLPWYVCTMPRSLWDHCILCCGWGGRCHADSVEAWKWWRQPAGTEVVPSLTTTDKIVPASLDLWRGYFAGWIFRPLLGCNFIGSSCMAGKGLQLGQPASLLRQCPTGTV